VLGAPTHSDYGWLVSTNEAPLVEVRIEEVFVEMPKDLLRCDDGGRVRRSTPAGASRDVCDSADTYVVRRMQENEFYIEVPKTVLCHPENILTHDGRESV
jgi:hypothetical protein